MMPDKIFREIMALSKQKKPFLIAVDGRCGAGKTTLSLKMKDRLMANVIHMDDFFLRPEQRTEERLLTPGGNIDHERFLKEVLMPILKNEPFSYRPYCCQSGMLKEPVGVSPSPVYVVEGAYSCHPKLWDFYDLHIFLDIEPQKQLQRIIGRNGKKAAEQFEKVWIPLEEKYFEAFRIRERCEYTLR